MTEFDVLRTSAAGMDAQRASLEVAARNVAAAEVAPAGAFTRLVPQFSTADASDEDGIPNLFGDGSDDDTGEEGAPIRFIGTQAQRGAGVDAVTEMVAVLDAQRAYEANASVFEDGKRLMEREIDLGRT
jgi:flagellar basal body rod protein FlgC